MQMDEMTKNARNKSIGKKKDKVVRVSEKKFKRFFYLSMAIIGLSVTASVVHPTIDSIQKGKVVREYIDEVRGKVNEETHFIPKSVDYYYDVGDLIDYIEEDPEQTPERLFAVMYGMGFNHSFNTDEFDKITASVFRNEDGTAKYKTFEEFLLDNNYVDKDGNASIKAYSDEMKEYIYAKEQYMKEKEDLKGFNR